MFYNKRWQVGGRYGYSAIDCEMPDNNGIHHTVIAGLTRKVADLITSEHNTEIDYARQEIAELKDKLHRRNMQIAELKKKIALAYSMGVESTYSPAKGRARDKQIQKMIAEEKE